MSENGVHKPRLCKVVKGENGYGFHLHGEKGKVGQRIRKVEEGSAAENAGLRAGDKIVCVNGTNVEKDSHQEVVQKIKERENEAEMLVVDEDTEKYLEEKGIPITLELLSAGATMNDTPNSEETWQTSEADEMKEVKDPHLRPRCCDMQKGDGGYGFNLHSEKGKPGRYIRSVDPDTPAEKAGLKAGDRIIEVNGKNMEYEKHALLVTSVKESGDTVSLLVVDEEADKFFKSCDVTPSSKHLTGPLPTPKPPKEEEKSVDLMAMDLSTLLNRQRESKKKKAPTSDWQKRQAMFNNL